MDARIGLRPLACVAAMFFVGAASEHALAFPRAAEVAQVTRSHASGATYDSADLTLVKSTGGRAVVRLGTGPLELVFVGDRLGRNQAEVKEVVSGRLVMEERFTGADGRPNVAKIILKDGERGGKRYLRRPERPEAKRAVAIDGTTKDQKP